MKLCKKTSFCDEKQANLHIERIKKKSKRDIIPKRAYLCRKCNTWHLTSKDLIITPLIKLKNENEKLKKEISNKEYMIKNTVDLIDKIEIKYQKITKTLTEKNNLIKQLESELSRKNDMLNSLKKILK